MTRHASTIDQRYDEARAAWSALDHGGHNEVVLNVQCQRAHHVAAVFATPAGLVFRAPIRARAHGSKDRVDEIHGAGETEHFFDFLELEQDVDDELPAWCDCGPRLLSRRAVRAWIDAHEKRVVVD